MSGAIEKFRNWYIKKNIPVVGGALQADILYNGAPLYYGTSGTIGPRKGNFILQNADFILVLGNSLPTKQTGFYVEGFAPNAKIAMVDVSEDEMKKPGLNIALRIHADINEFLDATENKLKPWSNNKEWLDYLNSIDGKIGDIDAKRDCLPQERVSYYSLAEAILKHDDSAWYALGNSNGMCGFLQIGAQNSSQKMIVNYNTGSMGDDLPEAVGMAVAGKNQRQIIVVTGDGSIMMNLQELQTIKHYNLPIKVVILSNDGYGALRQTNKNFFNGTYIGCDAESGVSFPNWEMVARAFGFKYIGCNNNMELDEKTHEFLQSSEHTIYVVKQRQDDPIIPKVMSKLSENGTFSSPCLHEMFPFLEEEIMKELMIDKQED